METPGVEERSGAGGCGVRVESVRWSAASGWSGELPALDGASTLVLALAGPRVAPERVPVADLDAAYPASVVVGFSTAGVVEGEQVLDDAVLVVAVRFDATRLVLERAPLDRRSSHADGRRLGARLRRHGDDLAGVLVVADGLSAVGNALAAGLVAGTGGSVPVFGGMSAGFPGLEGALPHPWTLLDGRAERGVVVGVGMYGERITFTTGTGSGWADLGPERRVTRSSGATLFEVDGQPALELYRRYLGEEARGLPVSGLRFPLAIRRAGERSSALVRSVRSIDEEANAIGLTGDVPEGSAVQLLHQDSEALADAAETAARTAAAGAGGAARPGADGTLAFVVSCLGRRMALGARTEDELEAVAAGLPGGTPAVGFYTYGELAPTATRPCDLHNETMTVAVLSERSR